MFAAGHQASKAFAQAHLGLPADVLDAFGWCFQSQLQMSTDWGGVARGPSPFDEGTPRMGIAGFGDRPLPVALRTGILRGPHPQAPPELSGMVKAGEVPELSHHRNRHRELHAA